MDHLALWTNFLTEIQNQIDEQNFKFWFNNKMKFKQFENDTFEVFVNSSFTKEQMVARFQPMMVEILAQLLNQTGITILYEVAPVEFEKATVTEEDDYFEINEAPVHVQQNFSLNPKYTIDKFVVGLTNNLAFAAAQAVIQNPGISYNPLFIYGPSGVGKTHLMHAIGNALIAKNPNWKVLYVSSERFMNDFVDSIKTKQSQTFRTKYRSCNVLLVDDVQFFSGKDSTQEEFFHVFNELHGRSAQVVLTSDRQPQDIQKLEDRLASRFAGGLMVDIQMPDFDTRIAIIKAKLEESGERLPDDIINAIAERTESNTRELEGKLISIVQYLKLSNTPPTLEAVSKYLGSNQPKSNILDHKKVTGVINQYFNIKMSDLVGPRRQKELVLPRQITMFLLYEDAHMPFEKVGEVLGGRDHTTVMHGVDKIKEVSSRDREVQRMLIEIRALLN